MKIEVPTGKYVLAVSGGVDSMALLDILSKRTDIELIVAHFNHGIRPDSGADEALVIAAAEKYGLKYEIGQGKLARDASEETARLARYGFLESVKREYRADKIITAHHEDDWIETSFINLIRGSGRLGLSAIASNPKVIRPLLKYPKTEILDYASKHHLSWREDRTNSNEKYLRNYIRRRILPKLSPSQRQDLTSRLRKIERLNAEINSELSELAGAVIDRYEFASLPVDLGGELLVEWLRRNNVHGYDAKTIQRLNMAIRTARPRSVHPVKSSTAVYIDKTKAKLIQP